MSVQTIPIHMQNLNLDTDIRKKFAGWYITSTATQERMDMDAQLTFSSKKNLHDRAYLHIHYELNKDNYACGVQLFVAHPKHVDTLCFRVSYTLVQVQEMSKHPYMDYLRDLNSSRGFTGDPMIALIEYLKDHPANFVETNKGYLSMLDAGRGSIK